MAREMPRPPAPVPGPKKFLLTLITNCNKLIAYCDNMSNQTTRTARAIVIEAAKALPFRVRAELSRAGTRTQKEYTPNL